MGPELELGLNSRPSHEIADRSQPSHISGIPGRFFAGSASVFLQRRRIAGSSPAMTTRHLYTVGKRNRGPAPPHAIATGSAAAENFFMERRNPARGCALLLAERTLRPSEFVRPRT